MQHDRRHVRRGEGGFTLIELLIVVIIIAILVALVSSAMKSAKVASRNEGMKAAAASVDKGLGTFNRIYPRVGASDPFLARGNGADWSGNTGPTATGMADETGAWIISEWPDNPFSTTGGVVLSRFASPAPCAAGAALGDPGDIFACRGAAGGMTYSVRAFGRDRNENAIEVYRADHGAR